MVESQDCRELVGCQTWQFTELCTVLLHQACQGILQVLPFPSEIGPQTRLQASLELSTELRTAWVLWQLSCLGLLNVGIMS